MVAGVLRKLGVSLALAGAVFTGLGIALGVGPAIAPAAAQLQSEGYRFLKAVDERDGDTVTEMLNQPGTTVINTRDITSGDTGLHIVVQRGDTLWVKFLIQQKADPNIRNRKGITPLQLATSLNLVDAIEELIKGGAQVNVTDQTGETPLIAAVHARNVPMVRLLLAKGADPDHNDNSGRSARDYIGLLASNQLLVAELAKADAERKNAGTTKQYGPSF